MNFCACWWFGQRPSARGVGSPGGCRINDNFKISMHFHYSGGGVETRAAPESLLMYQTVCIRWGAGGPRITANALNCMHYYGACVWNGSCGWPGVPRQPTKEEIIIIRIIIIIIILLQSILFQPCQDARRRIHVVSEVKR